MQKYHIGHDYRVMAENGGSSCRYAIAQFPEHGVMGVVLYGWSCGCHFISGYGCRMIALLGGGAGENCGCKHDNLKDK